MKTLVIHPSDPSTDMLKHVYMGKDYTVIQNPNVSPEALRQAIIAHDRIIMLGHGVPQGLIDPNVMTRRGGHSRWYLIDDSFGKLLKTKDTVSIWCYSDQYFLRHGIKGFHTGMIISEVKEAQYVLGHSPLTEDALWKNMVTFSKLLGECIELDAHGMQEYMLTHYVGDDAITQFNRENLLVLT